MSLSLWVLPTLMSPAALLEHAMNSLLFSLLSRASIATPVANAQAYLDSRAEDNLKLGDISKLPYGNVARKGNTWSVETARGVVRGTETEVRAAILRVYW